MSHQSNIAEQLTMCVCQECIAFHSRQVDPSFIKNLTVRNIPIFINEQVLKQIKSINELLQQFPHLFFGGLLYSGTDDSRAYHQRKDHRHTTTFSFTTDELMVALIHTEGMMISANLAVQIVSHLQLQLEREQQPKQQEEKSDNIPF